MRAAKSSNLNIHIKQTNQQNKHTKILMYQIHHKSKNRGWVKRRQKIEHDSTSRFWLIIVGLTFVSNSTFSVPTSQWSIRRHTAQATRTHRDETAKWKCKRTKISKKTKQNIHYFVNTCFDSKHSTTGMPSQLNTGKKMRPDTFQHRFATRTFLRRRFSAFVSLNASVIDWFPT